MLKTKSGISKVYFVELPNDVQQRFHYNAAIAAAYSAQGARQAGLVTGRGQPVEVISHGAQVGINKHLALGSRPALYASRSSIVTNSEVHRRPVAALPTGSPILSVVSGLTLGVTNDD